MKIKRWQKVLVGFLVFWVCQVLAAGVMLQIDDGHFLNPTVGDPKISEQTFAEKVEAARKRLNFGR